MHDRHQGRTEPSPALLKALPFAIMMVLAVADAWVGRQALLLPLLALGPAFTALAAGAGYTLAIGAAAFALGVGDAAWERLDARQTAITLATVAGVTLASVIASRVRQRRERELADVQAVARVSQEVVLRPLPRSGNPVEFAVRYISANSRAQIGGDVYEVIHAPGGARLLIGDVQGKGLAAVQSASVILGAFREAAYDTADLRGIAARLELSVSRQLAHEEEFISAVLGHFSADGSRLRLLNCGHPPPLLVPAAGRPRFVEPARAGLPLGLSALADSPPEVTTVELAPGDRVLFYTDGVTEARNASGEYFPLIQSSDLLAGGKLEASLAALHEDVVRHVGHPLDDDAALLLARLASPQPPA